METRESLTSASFPDAQFGDYFLASEGFMDWPEPYLRETFTRRLDVYAAAEGMKIDPSSVRWGTVEADDPFRDDLPDGWYKGDAYYIRP